jgi:hypothetical protein
MFHGSLFTSARIDRVTDNSPRRVFLHIGTHKTGTTSFQKWLRENEDDLRSRFGLGVYLGGFPNNRELGLACANTDRLLPVRRIPQWSDHLWRDHVNELARVQMQRDEPSIIVSAESLSFLRADEEVRRVQHMFADREVTILLTLREPADFLASWGRHLTRSKYELSDDPKSFAYVAADSWLARYDDLIDVFGRVFGRDRVLTVDYEEATSEHGSVIPGLMRHLVGDVRDLPDWSGYRFNTSAQFATPRRFSPRWALSRLGHIFRRTNTR